MNRRNFLGLGLSAITLGLAPSLNAINFRETKPKAWTASKVELAIKEIFGTNKTINEKVKLKAPDIAENGAVVPITVSSKLKGSKVAIFQDANPQSTVAVFTVPKGGILNYEMRIKMSETGTVTAIVEENGKLYKAEKLVKVTIGGCGG